MFPWEDSETGLFERRMEAAGIEPAQDSPGTLYAIQAAHGGPVKIGWTSRSQSVTERLRSLQTGNPYALRVIWTCEGSREDEAELHHRFRRWKLAGEWFDVATEIAEFFGLNPNLTPLEHVYDQAYDAGWQRGLDDRNWELEGDRSLTSERKADSYDHAHRTWTLTGSPWALRRLRGKAA